MRNARVPALFSCAPVPGALYLCSTHRSLRSLVAHENALLRLSLCSLTSVLGVRPLPSSGSLETFFSLGLPVRSVSCLLLRSALCALLCALLKACVFGVPLPFLVLLLWRGASVYLDSCLSSPLSALSFPHVSRPLGGGVPVFPFHFSERISSGSHDFQKNERGKCCGGPGAFFRPTCKPSSYDKKAPGSEQTRGVKSIFRVQAVLLVVSCLAKGWTCF